MLEPMSARLASLCSRNGIRLAETPTSCLGETSTKLTSLGPVTWKSPLYLARTFSGNPFPYRPGWPMHLLGPTPCLLPRRPLDFVSLRWASHLLPSDRG